MGKASRDKGSRTEREVVRICQDHGIDARRVPLSGATWMKGDVEVLPHWSDEPLRLEVKCRANGFKQIYGWIEDNHGLVIKADRQDMLLVARLHDAIGWWQ